MQDLQTGERKFWDNPEGTLGMVVSSLIGVGVLWGLWVAIPFLLSLMVTTMMTIVVGLGLFAMAVVLFNRRTWLLAGYAFKAFMRRITNVFIPVFARDIVESNITEMQERRQQVTEGVQSLRGQIEVLDRQIEKNATAGNRAVGVVRQVAARAEHEQGEEDKQAAAFQLRQATRLRRSNLRLEDVRQKLVFLFNYMRRLNVTLGYVVDDARAELEVNDQEGQALGTSSSIIRNTIAIMNGDPTKKELVDKSMQWLANDSSMKIGEIRSFLDTFGPRIRSLELEEQAADADMMSQIEELEGRGTSLFVDASTHQALLTASNDPTLLTFDGLVSDREKVPAPATRSVKK